MAVKWSVRKSKDSGKRRVLVIDFWFKDQTGAPVRYRRDSDASTRAAALEEERGLRDRCARYGSPFEPVAPEPPKPKLVSEVIEEFESEFLPSVKMSTRCGYEQVIKAWLKPKFAARPITDADAIGMELDVAIAKRSLAKTTRNNILVVLRSIVRFAREKKYVSVTSLPKLKQIGQRVLEIPTEDQVARILGKAKFAHRLAFALIAFGGLRPNEVRALRWRDIADGYITVREGRCHDVVDAPKTGERLIPISPRLRAILPKRARPDQHVSFSTKGTPWSQIAITVAFNRIRDSLKLSGWSVYSLRHFAITSWLRRGIPISTVMKMAGHSNLSTTAKYTHVLRSDLEVAARLLADAAE